MTGNRRVKTPRERRRQKIAFWSVSALLLAYAVLGGDYKLYHLVFLTSEKDRVERRIDELAAENAVLADEERRLEGDTLLLERLAREKGMKRKGEIIYRLMPLKAGEVGVVPESGVVGKGGTEGPPKGARAPAGREEGSRDAVGPESEREPIEH